MLFQCLNVLVQHGTSTDYVDDIRSKPTKSKNPYHKKVSSTPSSSQNTLLSKSSTGSSDTEPFYLHPPNIRNGDGAYNQSRTPPELYGSVIPNDGLYINPMRNGILTPTSPNGSISGESFYLHDPQEVIYNRVKDLFDSDTASNKDGSSNGGVHPNAMTVQVEVHSSSSGAGSGSEESLSVSSSSDVAPKPTNRSQITNGNSNINANNSNSNTNTNGNNLPELLANNPAEHHDYEDIYLVREEARNNSKGKYGTGRSRSRDSGSHSRSASASSTHSTDIIVHYGSHVRFHL